MQIKLPIILHKNQELIHQSQALNVVVKSGKRFGKTDLALYKLIKWACETPNGTFWYLTDTFGHAEDIGWKRLNELIPKYLIRSIDKTKLSVTLAMNSTIKMMSADDPNRLRGTKIHGIVWEEAAYIKEGLDIWAIIQGQLGSIGNEAAGKSFFISSPNRQGLNWFSLFYEEALRRKSLGESWDAFKFTVWDNPLYTRETIQGWKEGMTEDQWEVEYMANESAHAGQIISEFNYGVHVGEFENPKDAFFVRGLDWGISHPTTCLWMYVDIRSNMVYVCEEYKKSGKLIEESCSIIKQITGSRKVDWSVIDPSTAKRNSQTKRTDCEEFGRNGIFCQPGDNRDRGYDVMKLFFKKNMIKIHPKCRNLINEIKSVQWGDKEAEDCLDALRYALLRIHDVYFGGNLGLKEEKQKEKNPNEFNFNDLPFKPKIQGSMEWAYADDYEEVA